MALGGGWLDLIKDLGIDKQLQDIGQATVAGLGGIIAALLRKETNGAWETLIAGAGAMFLGFIVAKVCRLAGLNDDTSAIIIALSGWMGAERTSMFLQSWIERKTGIDIQKENEDDK